MPEQGIPETSKVTILPPDKKKEAADEAFSRKVWNTPRDAVDRLKGPDVIGAITKGGKVPKIIR